MARQFGVSVSMSATLSLAVWFILLGGIPGAICVWAASRRDTARPLPMRGKIGVALIGLVLVALPGGCSLFWTGLNVIQMDRARGDFDITFPWIVTTSGFPVAAFGIWLIVRALNHRSRPPAMDPPNARQR
jgi:hypothetical protein